MSIAVGAPAPDFTMPATGGRTVSLTGQRGRPFVLYFYPRADTPGCTREACAFQDTLPQFDSVGIDIIGVSRDAMPALERFAAKYNLSFPLASDASGVAEAYGAWVEKTMYGKTSMGLDRSTILVDGEGRIARIWRRVKVDGHAAAVQAAAQALRGSAGTAAISAPR
jgi:thioredoxin-dependent peroxiredoxin